MEANLSSIHFHVYRQLFYVFQGRVGSPLSPFFYPEHLGSPPPAHMGGVPYSLDPHKGPVSEYTLFWLFLEKTEMIKTKKG